MQLFRLPSGRFRGARLSSICFAIISLVQLFGNPAGSFAQDHSRFLKWMYQDVVASVEGARPRDALIVGGAALFVAGGSHVDPDILEAVQKKWDGTEPVLKFADRLGTIQLGIPLAGLFGASLITHSTRFQDAAFTSLQSWLYVSVITTGIKFAAGRERPEDGNGARSFLPFSGHSSMPSGHTSHIFAAITPWIYYYPNVATYGLLAVGATTAVARVALDKHWPTDVIIGGGLGFLTGRFLSRQHRNSKGDDGPLSVMPEVGLDHFAVRLTLHVD